MKFKIQVYTKMYPYLLVKTQGAYGITELG